MKHIKNKSIKYGLRILTILAFVLIFAPFNVAHAYYSSQCTSGDWGSTCQVGGDGNVNGDSPIYQPPIYTAPPVVATPIVYSTATNPNPVTPTTVVIHHKTTQAVATNTCGATTATANPNSGNGLAASAVYGSNSFLPSGLIQWILFAIFILLIVILARHVFGSKKKYQESPLKHD
jgi:hypothetical protein